MSEEVNVVDALESRVRRREGRREFFKAIGGAAMVAGGAAVAGGGFTALQAQTAPTELDVLNFALNLEYLEAQFYYYASYGSGLPNSILTGTGTQGAVIATGAGAVPFTDPAVRAYAREIADDERAHVEFLRTAIGSTSTVSQPAIDISATPTSAFSNAARAAGLIGAGATFNPYADDNNFLLGAFIFEDVGVTAYKGAASALINNKTFLEAAAGILAVEAYHAAIVRTTLYGRGVTALVDATESISNARDSLDGASDIDQGVRQVADASGSPTSNIVPLDSDGLAFSRTTGQVLNVVYLNRAQVTAGGFFPNGVNGTIRASAAN